jgi:MFS family permease
MKPPAASLDRRRILAHVIFALTLLGIVAGIVFAVLDARRGTRTGHVTGDLTFILGFTTFPIVGYVLASRRPDNNVSWVMLGIGAALGLDAFLNSYAAYAIHGGGEGVTLGAAIAAIDSPMWVPIVAVSATFLILLFPDGHLPSPRWRWFAWLLGVSLAIVFLAILLSPGPMKDSGYPNVRNPLGPEALRPVLDVAIVSFVMLPVGVIAALVSLVKRFRRSTGVERL